MSQDIHTHENMIKYMIYSMTGFGKATAVTDTKKITIEIKSVNSKQFDLSMRLPYPYREREMELRTLLLQRIERGKVECNLSVETTTQEIPGVINSTLLESYYKQLKQIAQQSGIPEPSDWFPTLLRMPDVMKPEVQTPEEEEWSLINNCLLEAIDAFAAFRKQEGDSLVALFTQKIGNIESLLGEVPKYENERVEKIRERITEALTKIESLDYDRNRLEQEMIFYIEKLDISEEKLRLTNHLNYFRETLALGGGQGKKLGFILQEIGREINTLGSKSNHHELQKIVVQMKDELEQMKEQVLNVM